MRGACPLSTLPVMGYLSFRKSISAVDVLLQADKAYCSLTKKAAFGAQHNRQRVHSVCTEPGGGYAMTAFPRWGKVERELPRRKTSLAACGRRHTRRHNDTPALNALKALRGAPISMGRGEIPVGGCQPPAVLAVIYSVIITTYNFYYFGRYPHDR